MSVEQLLSRLDRVRRTGPGRWIASCPTSAHARGDRHPSLGIRETEDGLVLLRCHAYGCAVQEIVGAVGLDLSDLFPSKPIEEHARGECRPFLPSEVFNVVRQEIAVAAVIAADMRKGREISDADYERLFVVVERLNGIASAAYGRG